jgi:hypothetical protein
VFACATGVFPEKAEKGSDRRPDVIRKVIDNPLAVPGVLDQARVPKDPELMGDARLGHPQDEHDLANAQVAFEKEPDDPEAGPVGERFEYP